MQVFATIIVVANSIIFKYIYIIFMSGFVESLNDQSQIAMPAISSSVPRKLYWWLAGALRCIWEAGQHSFVCEGGDGSPRLFPSRMAFLVFLTPLLFILSLFRVVGSVLVCRLCDLACFAAVASILQCICEWERRGSRRAVFPSRMAFLVFLTPLLFILSLFRVVGSVLVCRLCDLACFAAVASILQCICEWERRGSRRTVRLFPSRMAFLVFLTPLLFILSLFRVVGSVLVCRLCDLACFAAVASILQCICEWERRGSRRAVRLFPSRLAFPVFLTPLLFILSLFRVVGSVLVCRLCDLACFAAVASILQFVSESVVGVVALFVFSHLVWLFWYFSPHFCSYYHCSG